MILSNCSRELLEEISAVLGDKGKITVHKWKKAWTDGQSLRFNHNEIREILPKIVPYLKLKQKLAELMIESLDIISKEPKSDERSYKLNLIIANFRKMRLTIPGHKCWAQRSDDDVLKELLEKHK